jgi:signal transduction histidine kinase
MARLLDSVLTIGRSEAGELDFNPKPMDLVAFCGDLVETMQQSSPGTPIAYAMRGEPNGALADEQLLRHILTNLISNAIKYSPPQTPVDIEIDIEKKEATFLVRDRGIGIPAVDRVDLFNSFHRGSNVGDIPGTGLGLAVVKRSVDRHGGLIELESAEGVGTTFVVTIPLEGKP